MTECNKSEQIVDNDHSNNLVNFEKDSPSCFEHYNDEVCPKTEDPFHKALQAFVCFKAKSKLYPSLSGIPYPLPPK